MVTPQPQLHPSSSHSRQSSQSNLSNHSPTHSSDHSSTVSQSAKSKLFRPEALERSASPDELDQLVQVVSPHRWLSLAALGTVVVAGCLWSVFGRIPINVSGQGVLVPLPITEVATNQWRVDPSQIVRIQTPSAGRLLTVAVRTGDRVQLGDVLATLEQTEVEQQLQLAQDKLVQLQQQDQSARTAQRQRDIYQQTAIAQQRQTLQQSLQTVQSLTPILREKGIEAIQQERRTLQQRLQTLQAQIPTYEQRWQARQVAHSEGALSRDMVLQAEQEYLNAQAQLNEAESQLKQLDVQEADAQREYLNSVNQADELRAQLSQLETQAASQQEQDLVAATARQKEIQETQRAIAQLQLQLQQASKITSPYAGKILEVSAKPGERMDPGMSVVTLSAQGDSTPLVGLMFLPVSEGNKITPGMKVQMTPTTVKREEYGGIVGTVFEVSQYPITRAGAASLIGNPDMLPSLMTEEPHVAVFARLETHSATRTQLASNTTATSETLRYRWSSSQGPNQAIAPGTTATARITVEARAPISYVLPVLKSLTGLN
ncbi:NHLP bacteriocin system secretion protein [Leptolyngbya sp. AN02str]|uniref:NHLP bacteriocin system secretion protein n=1 Tax=Leptolyngbya sp. AN02str TaxID=3423363 RepID=UPI003D31A3A5